MTLYMYMYICIYIYTFFLGVLVHPGGHKGSKERPKPSKTGPGSYKKIHDHYTETGFEKKRSSVFF